MEIQLIVALSVILAMRIVTLVALRSGAPEYVDKISVYVPGAFGLVSGLFLTFVIDSRNFFEILGYAVTGSVFMWNAVHSLFTDSVHYRVDRWSLRSSILICGLVSLPNFIMEKLDLLPILLILLILASSTFLMDKVGASDTRAMLLIIIAAGMNLSFENFYAGVILSSITTFVVSLIISVVKRSWKVKIPLIPPMLLPFALLFIFPIF